VRRDYKCLCDFLQHAVKILQNIVIPKPQHTVTLLRQFIAALLIFGYLLGVLSAIEFDHQLACRTGKIGDATTDRVLATKFPRRKALAQSAPENLFDIGRVASQLPCDLCALFERDCPPPHPTSPP
jgi:hypothetical protein